MLLLVSLRERKVIKIIYRPYYPKRSVTVFLRFAVKFRATRIRRWDGSGNVLAKKTLCAIRPSAVAPQLFTVHCQFQQRAKVAVSL